MVVLGTETNPRSRGTQLASSLVRYRLEDFTPPQVTPRGSFRGRGWRGACRAGRWAGAWAGRAVVGSGRRGGGCAPGRAVGGANAKGGGRGPDMDKLKKVLSGQDTEDRSGLSEVSVTGEAGVSWKAVLLSSRPRAELCWDTATGGSAGSLWKAWLSNPPQRSLRRAGVSEAGPQKSVEWECGVLDPRPRPPPSQPDRPGL